MDAAGTLYVLVVPSNGASSLSPYHLSAKAGPLPGISACNNDFAHPVGAAAPVYTGTTTTLSGTATYAQPLSLILINKQRLDRAYGSASTLDLMSTLRDLADETSVRGVVVPVENDSIVGDAYGSWDTGDACSPLVANHVAEAIKTNVVLPYFETYSPTLRYLVIVGDDLMIPFRRVSDDTFIANESLYLGPAQLDQDNATHAALSLGYILSDDFYADLKPLRWRGRDLYLPDLAVGRLVEKPGEIRAIVEQYLARGGVFTPTTALVTGYDFLIDSGEAISATLGARGFTSTLTTLIIDTWTDGDLEAGWLGQRQDLASLNAHFQHFEAIPPTGTQTTTAGEVASATNGMSGTVNFSMGCHAGYSVHDEHATAGEPLDFPQALARQAAWWIGNTGFGYGDSDVIAYTEQLMRFFVRRMTSQAQMPVGRALIEAKREYLGTVPSGGFGTYDEKAMIESTLYGLPMYRISVPEPRSWDLDGPPIKAARGGAVLLAGGVYSVGKTLDITYDPQHATADGSFYTIDALAQVNPGRPIQPKISTGLELVAGMRPHGALFLQGTSTPTPAFDPVIARPVSTSTEVLKEPRFMAEAWFPARMFTVNRLGDRDRLVVVPAQFLGDQDEGELRRFTELVFTVVYSDSIDFLAPVIWQVESTIMGDRATFGVSAEDGSGIERVLVTYSPDDRGWQSADLTYDGTAGWWTVSLPGLTDETSYFIQVMDRAGNVTVSDNKGRYFTPKRYDVYLPIVLRAPEGLP